AFPGDTTDLAQLLQTEISGDKGYFKIGNPYNLDRIKEEYARLASVANSKGYYFFNGDYIQLFVDSSSEKKNSLDIRLEIKKNVIPPAAYQAFTINNIYICSNYR